MTHYYLETRQTSEKPTALWKNVMRLQPSLWKPVKRPLYLKRKCSSAGATKNVNKRNYSVQNAYFYECTTARCQEPVLSTPYNKVQTLYMPLRDECQTVRVPSSRGAGSLGDLGRPPPSATATPSQIPAPPGAPRPRARAGLPVCHGEATQTRGC